MRRLRPLEAGSQTQMGWMLDDGGGEQGIADLKQCVTTAAEGGINLMTKGAQALKGVCFHAPEYAKARLSCLSPFALSLLLVKWQA